MKRLLLVLVFAAGWTLTASGQAIIMTRSFGGTRFEMDTLTLSTSQVLELMRINPVAHDQFKKGRIRNNIAGVLGFTGALLIAVPLTTAVAGGHPEWTLAAVGGALIIASIPINRSWHRLAQTSVDEYNRQLGGSRPGSRIYFSATGVRIVVHF